MIKLSDPGVVEAGSTVCITATNVNAGVQFKGNSKSGNLRLMITVNLVNHTATICFVAPAEGGMVRIFGADGSSGKTTTISVLVRK